MSRYMSTACTAVRTNLTLGFTPHSSHLDTSHFKLHVRASRALLPHPTSKLFLNMKEREKDHFYLANHRPTPSSRYLQLLSSITVSIAIAFFAYQNSSHLLFRQLRTPLTTSSISQYKNPSTATTNGDTITPANQNSTVNYVENDSIPLANLKQDEQPQTQLYQQPQTQTQTQTQTNLQDPTSIEQNECFKVIPYRNTYAFSRYFCVKSSTTTPICVSPRTFYDRSVLYFPESLKQQTCRITSPSLTDNLVQDASTNCSEIHQNVTCAHGQYDISKPIKPECPLISYSLPVNSASLSLPSSDILIVIPSYPYLKNIYHFAHAIVSTIHTASSLPLILKSWKNTAEQKKITILFRDTIQPFEWQSSITKALIQHRLVGTLNVKYDIETFNEKYYWDKNSGMSKESYERQLTRQKESTICSNNVVLIGKRESSNIWPFSGGSTNMKNGSSVPLESLAFRKSMYTFSKLSTNLPSVLLTAPGYKEMTKPINEILVDLPTLTLGYAKRNNESDPLPGQYMFQNTRRFNERDEEWFTSMLQQEAKNYGFYYRTVLTPAGTKFSTQVSLFKSVGFLAGIHGANLMNVIFMPPFSSILEIANVITPCYIAGANSGIHYQSYKPSKVATPSESYCPPSDTLCNTSDNYRSVVINQEIDHIEIRRLVRVALERVKFIHNSFKHLDGVPATFNPTTGEYEINWSKAKYGAPI